MDPQPTLKWSQIVTFVRQHTHDVRNQLNGLELEAALLADMVEDSEVLQAVARIRSQVRQLAGNLRSLSARFTEPQPAPSPIAARELFLIWQDQAKALGAGAPKLVWLDELGNEMVNVDASAIADVMKELLINAKHFGEGREVRAWAHPHEAAVVFELHEPIAAPVDPRQWGQTPFISTRRGAYGLGLWEARRLVEASGGRLRHQYDSDAKELVSQIELGCAA